MTPLILIYAPPPPLPADALRQLLERVTAIDFHPNGMVSRVEFGAGKSQPQPVAFIAPSQWGEYRA